MRFDAAQAYRDGTGSFEAFVLECAATASGARDVRDGRDKSSGYVGFLSDEYKADTSRTVLERLHAELAEVESWDKATADKKAEADYKKQCAKYQEGRAAYQAWQERHKAMYAEVEAWQPPTPAYESVKRHMLHEVEANRQNRPIEPLKPSRWSGKRLKEERIKSLTYAINKLTEIGATPEEQQQRHEAWMRVLRESLGLPPVATPRQ